MRIVKDSTAEWILDTLEEYGQLPYSFLNLAPDVSGDTAKKVIQKLIRAGYIEKKMPKEAIPTSKDMPGSIRSRASGARQRQHPVLSISEKGFYACLGEFDIPFSRHPFHEYDQTRIAAVALANEAKLLMHMAGLEQFYTTGRAYKQQQRDRHGRAADSIQGSRLAGILKTVNNHLLVYNFGVRNRKLNESAEAAMLSSVGEHNTPSSHNGHTEPPSMLILGEKDSALLSILRLTEMMRTSSKRFANIQAPFHLKKSAYNGITQAYFYLPVSREVLPLLHALRRDDWYRICNSRIASHAENFQNCLSCDCTDYLEAKEKLEERGQVEIHCYNWQVPILKEYLQSERITYRVYEPLEAL